MARVLYQLLVLFFDTSGRYRLRRLFDGSYGLCIFLGSLIRIYGHRTRLLLKARLCIVVVFVHVLQLVLMILLLLVLWLLASATGDLPPIRFILLQLIGRTVQPRIGTGAHARDLVSLAAQDRALHIEAGRTTGLLALINHWLGLLVGRPNIFLAHRAGVLWHSLLQ